MDAKYLPIENKDSMCAKVHSELLFAAKAMGTVKQQMCEKNSCTLHRMSVANCTTPLP